MGFLTRFHLHRQLTKGLDRFSARRVKELMTDYVVTITQEKLVTDAAALMIGEDISALVVEEEGKPIGILTERDFITKVPLNKSVLDLPVSAMMSCVLGKDCPVESVSPETKAKEAVALLKERRIRKLVVLEDGRIAGIITQTDISRALTEVKVIALVKAPLLVKEVMTKKIVSIEDDATFAKAKALMTKQNVSSLPVTKRGKYVGIFTEYDVVMQFYEKGGKLDIRSLPEVIHSPIKVIPADINIFEANTIMFFEKVRRLLVVEGAKVVGIVTQTDLIHACCDYLRKLEEYRADKKLLKKAKLIALRGRSSIISEYVNQNLRAYHMKD